MRRLILCLDGTSNSTYNERKRHDRSTVLKPTNTLKVARAIKPVADDGTEQIVYYDIGVGALARYPGFFNWALHAVDRKLGGGWGAGFEGNVEDALHFLTLNHRPGDEVLIFGFSRGAATARAVTRFLEVAGGLPQKNDAYYLPELFRKYIISRGAADSVKEAIAAIDARHKDKVPPLAPLQPVRVSYLGVWDTVMALGLRFASLGGATSEKRFGFHAGTTPAACVDHARQALSIDETRFDFRPEIWTGTNPLNPNQTLEQRWFAGVHSNVGGGYELDGLANIAFHWMLNGAKAQAHLEVDDAFAAKYPANPRGTMYNSRSLGFIVAELVRFATGRGHRKLVGQPAGANLDLHPSVIERMHLEPSYRPKNVAHYLESKGHAGDAQLQEQETHG